MKTKILQTLKALIVTNFLTFGITCYSQTMEYEVINSFLSSRDDFKTDYQLVNPFLDGPWSIKEFNLGNPERWNDARGALVNSDLKDTLDFRVLFTEGEMKKVVKRIYETKSKLIDNELIEVPISFIDRADCKRGEKYIRLAYPTIISTKNDETFGFLYIEILQSLETGSGTIIVYKHIGKEWKLVYRYNLWMS